MKRNKPVWLLILADFGMGCLLILMFAFFHHVLPWIKSRAQSELQAATATATSAVEESTAPEASVETEQAEIVVQTEETKTETAEGTEQAEQAESEETQAPEEEAQQLTEWQIRFADHFTDEVVTTENSYTSPNVSVTVETVVEGAGTSRVCYYVADIYIASIDCFRTWLANETFELYSTQNIVEMDAASDAIISMTGDFYSYQYEGLMVRNGIQYRDHHSASDVCVLYADGTMETLHPEDYTPETLLQENIWQIWDFGPALLTEDGEIPSSYNVSTTVSYINPRSAVGYYEPGHYCFVVVDGRNSQWSVGMRLPELSQVFYDLGCKAAYNLDGGGSAVMVFDDEVISMQSNGGGRELGDILLIGEPTGLTEGLYEEESSTVGTGVGIGN